MWSARIYWIVWGCQNPGKYFIITDTCSLLQAWIWFDFPGLCSWYLHKLSLLWDCRQIHLNRISSQTFDDWMSVSERLQQLPCGTFLPRSFHSVFVPGLKSPRRDLRRDLSWLSRVWFPWAGAAEGFGGISCSRYSWEQLCPPASSTINLFVPNFPSCVGGQWIWTWCKLFPFKCENSLTENTGLRLFYSLWTEHPCCLRI